MKALAFLFWFCAWAAIFAGAHYFLAVYGEPQSLWLFRDVLGVM